LSIDGPRLGLVEDVAADLGRGFRVRLRRDLDHAVEAELAKSEDPSRAAAIGPSSAPRSLTMRSLVNGFFLV